MANTSFKGPVRSENGFRTISKSSVGLVQDWNTINTQDMRRYFLSEYWKQKPALNAVIGTAFTNADATHADNTTIRVAEMIANKDFEVLGTNMTTALVTFDTTRGGITITTAGADEDQAIIAPHLDTNQSAWQVVKWGTENSVEWDASISTNTITDVKIWAGLKLTNDQLIATDDDQAFFKFQTDATNSEAFTTYTVLHFVYSVAGTDYISALPITVAANTEYHLKIKIDAERKISIFVNGVQYNVSNVAGSTGGTSVTSVQPGVTPTRSLALTNDIDLIPYIGIETGTGTLKALDVHYQAISRVVFE